MEFELVDANKKARNDMVMIAAGRIEHMLRHHNLASSPNDVGAASSIDIPLENMHECTSLSRSQ